MGKVKSLSEWITILKRKQWDYFGTAHFRDKKFEAETINPIPSFIEQRKIWAHFGVFVGYMIQKFFRDREIAPETRIVDSSLIAEISLRLLKTYTEKKEVLMSRGVPVPSQDVKELHNNGQLWVASYKENAWRQAIKDAWLLSGLDLFYRGFIFPRTRPLNKEAVGQVTSFLERVLKWLKVEFSSVKTIYLNPKLNVSDLVWADADLIADDTLWDIKTTKYPEKAASSEVNLLLGYVSLTHYHIKKGLQKFPTIRAMGYLFPEQLTFWKRDLHDFGSREREEMIKRIKTLVEEGAP
ncbi:MAG: hypothetical protein ACFFDI_28355 [Promethearchaeota archaeon]